MKAEEGQEAVYFGKPNPIQEQCADLQVCPDLVLALVSLLGAAALLGFYVAATQNTNGKRKRRRSLDDGHVPSLSSTVPDLVIVGNNYKMNSYSFGSCMCCTTGWRNELLLLACMICMLKMEGKTDMKVLDLILFLEFVCLSTCFCGFFQAFYLRNCYCNWGICFSVIGCLLCNATLF